LYSFYGIDIWNCLWFITKKIGTIYGCNFTRRCNKLNKSLDAQKIPESNPQHKFDSILSTSESYTLNFVILITRTRYIRGHDEIHSNCECISVNEQHFVSFISLYYEKYKILLSNVW